MILPSKHLAADRALLTIGGRILLLLAEPRTVSAVWHAMRDQGATVQGSAARQLRYDEFVLALDLLFAIRAIHLHEGRVIKGQP